MHRLVPDFIIERFKEGNPYGELPAVGIFVDLSGFSDMTSTLMQLGQYGAEILASIMRDIFDPMIRSVYQHSGFIATFAGDSFTAIFPIDQESIESYKNPLAAAIEIQEKIAATSHQQTPKGEFNISVRIGIAAGLVNWGIIHQKKRERASYFFRGSAIEGCIESEKKAESGTIIFDESFHNALGKYIDSKPIDSHYQLVSVVGDLPNANLIQPVSVDVDNAKHFYPESIITQARTGEFRQIVNMFISLPTVRTEPQLEIFMQALFKLQNRYGGLLNRLDFGDKGSHLLLFWGAPVAYENDIGRALNFILELQTETAIPIKAGITYRIAHAGFIGSPIREEYTCYGQGVNLAARFMEGAGRGEVWIDEPIARRVEHYFDIEAVGEYTFKGFDQPQKVYSLYERRQQIDTFFPGRFFDREKEINQILHSSSPLWEGKPQNPLVIFGEPGIGKSRLINEFKQSEFLTSKKLLWARCQTDQVLRRSFNPFRYWTKNYFGISDLQSEARNKRNFNRKIDQLIAATEDPSLASELDRTRSFLGNLVNLFWDDSLFEQLDPQGRYENTIIGLITLMKAESKLQPLIVQIEDIQWLDEDSKAFLNQLCLSIKTEVEKSYPILIIATSRDTPHSTSLGKGIKFQTIELKPLPSQTILYLAEDMLAGSTGQSLIEAITNLAEGNPFFAEQIVLYLKEENLIKETDGEWGLVEKNTSFLPTDIRAVLVARLDQTEPEVKNVILTASTLGREFKASVLKQMMPFSSELDSILSKAEQASVWRSQNGKEFVFKSNLMRDAAYKMQTRSQRQNTHAVAVRVLEDLYRDDLSNGYHELAYHAENAMLTEKAIQYYLGAGTKASDNYQNNQAIYNFTKAIDLSPDVHNPDYFELLIKRENMYSLIGNREDQMADLTFAQQIANQLEDSLMLAKINNRLSNYYYLTGDFNQAILYAREAIKLATKNGYSEIEIESRNTWANSSRQQGDYQNSHHQAEHSLDLSKNIAFTYGICTSLNNLSMTANEQGDFSRAIEYLEESLQTARKANQFGLEAQTLNNLANIYGDLGDYSSAYEAYTQALELAQKTGTRLGEGLVNTNLGWLSSLLGDFESARKHLERSMRIAQEIGDIYNQTFSLINLSMVAVCQNDTDIAKSYAQQGLALARDLGHKPGEAFAATFLGHAVLAIERWDQAREWYQHGLDLRNELGQQNFAIEPLAGLAEVAHRTKGPEAASEMVLQILEFLDAGGTLDGIDQPFRIYTTCARVLLEVGHPRAQDFIREAYTLLQNQAAKIKDTKYRESFLMNVPFHDEIIRLYDDLD